MTPKMIMGSDKDPGHPVGGNDHWSPGYDEGLYLYKGAKLR